MSDATEWAGAFARQAKADFDTWNELQGRKAVCLANKLHFLQMCCEKLVKAHLCKAGAAPQKLQSSHAYIAKNLPIVVRQQLAQIQKRRINRHDFRIIQIRHLAREIELLSPAVDDGGRRPDNCEYPWEQDGRIIVPADYSFPNLQLLVQPVGRTLLKLIRSAILDLLK